MSTGNGLGAGDTGRRERRIPAAVTAGPQLECRSCHLPILLAFVVRDGDRRMIDCPLCDSHDEWTVDEGSSRS